MNDMDDRGVFLRDPSSAIAFLLFEFDRSMTFEEVVAAVKADQSVDGPAITAEAVAPFLGEDGRVGPLTSDAHESVKGKIERLLPPVVFRTALPYGLDPAFVLAVLSSAVAMLVDRRGQDPGDELCALLRPGMGREALRRVFDELGRLSDVGELPTRLKLDAWSDRWCLEVGRLVRLCVRYERRADMLLMWFHLSVSTTQSIEQKVVSMVDESMLPLMKSDWFPYERVVRSGAIEGDFFCPDARLAALVLHRMPQGSWLFRSVRVVGYCRNMDERDGLRMMLRAKGIRSELSIAETNAKPLLPEWSAFMVFISEITDLEATSDRMHQLEAWLMGSNEHRRGFLVVPEAAVQMEGAWADWRKRILDKDMLDSAVLLWQEKRTEGVLLLVLDNQKQGAAKGNVYFVDTRVQMQGLEELTEEQQKWYWGAALGDFMENRERIVGTSALIPVEVIKNNPAVCIAPDVAVRFSFAVISAKFNRESFKEFKSIQSVVEQDKLRSEEPSRWDLVDARRASLLDEEFVAMELDQPYVREQEEAMKAITDNPSTKYCYVRVPSIEQQKKIINDRKHSWGLLPVEGKPLTTKGFIENLTDQVRNSDGAEAERNLRFIMEELRRQGRAETLKDAKEALDSVGHDLRNLESRLDSKLKRMERGQFRTDHEVLGELISMTRKYLERSDEFRKDLGRVLESESYALEHVPDLRQLVQRVIDGLPSGNQVQWVPEIESGIEVWVDKGKLERCFQNLFENAIKHGRTEGRGLEIRITRGDRVNKGTRRRVGSSEVEHDEQADLPRDTVSIVVGNNGRPLSAPFKELVKYRSSEGSGAGTGLGLYMVDKWLNGMGGSLRQFRDPKHRDWVCMELWLKTAHDSK